MDRRVECQLPTANCQLLDNPSGTSSPEMSSSVRGFVRPRDFSEANFASRVWIVLWLKSEGVGCGLWMI